MNTNVSSRQLVLSWLVVAGLRIPTDDSTSNIRGDYMKVVKFPERRRPELPVSEAEENAFLRDSFLGSKLNFGIAILSLIAGVAVVLIIVPLLMGNA